MNTFYFVIASVDVIHESCTERWNSQAEANLAEHHVRSFLR